MHVVVYCCQATINNAVGADSTLGNTPAEIEVKDNKNLV